MKMVECGACLDDNAAKRRYGKCRLLFPKSDFSPKFCPFNKDTVAKWEQAPQENYTVVVKKSSHNTGSPKLLACKDCEIRYVCYPYEVECGDSNCLKARKQLREDA